MSKLIFEVLKGPNGEMLKSQKDKPKYSMPENERRWLVKSSYAENLSGEPHFAIKDKYIDYCRLRVRAAIHSVSGVKIYKLSKKYGSDDPVSEPITSIYLTEEEYNVFVSCLLYTSPSPRDATLSRMPSSA